MKLLNQCVSNFNENHLGKNHLVKKQDWGEAENVHFSQAPWGCCCSWAQDTWWSKSLDHRAKGLRVGPGAQIPLGHPWAQATWGPVCPPSSGQCPSWPWIFVMADAGWSQLLWQSTSECLRCHGQCHLTIPDPLGTQAINIDSLFHLLDKHLLFTSYV